MQQLSTLKRRARFIGLLYLLVIICAGFSQGYVRGTLVVPGDAAATAEHLLANEALFRTGFVTDLIAFLLDAIISVLLYQLLKPIHQTLAMLMAAFRLLAHPAIASLNLLNHYMALQVLGDASWMGAFSPEQAQSLALLLMEAHRIGYLIAGAFFGIHCLLLGYLLWPFQRIPKIFGALMMWAGITYLMESFGVFLLPGNADWLALLVGFSAAAGEVSLTLYLLIRGLR